MDDQGAPPEAPAGGDRQPGPPPLPDLFGRVRGRGGLRGLAGPRRNRPRQPPKTPDDYTRGTDEDALWSRQSAVRKGYFQDPFVFAMSVVEGQPRLPIINRGTYVRTTSIDHLVEQFLRSNTDRDVQIISLGAGTDTRYFRLRDKRLHFHLMYHEIDFPEISRNKLAAIRNEWKLSPAGSPFRTLKNYSLDGLTPWGFNTSNDESRPEGYMFHPMDLRNMPDSIEALQIDVPTLLISECCLCYLDKDTADKVISYFTTRLSSLGVVIYEPTNLGDAFGNMMLDNFAARNLSMPSIDAYSTPEKQRKRLSEAGFVDLVDSADISFLWDNWVSEAERERIAKIEVPDEIEEWVLLAQHYLIVWGFREVGGFSGGFTRWVSECEGNGRPKPPTPPPPKVYRNVWHELGLNN